MKVLQIYRTYFPDPPGGLQEAIRQICLSTQPHGVESTVYTLSPDPVPARIRRPEGEVVRAKSWWAPASCDLGLKDAIDLFSEEARKADVLHFQFPWPYADLLNLLPAARGKPRIMTYQSDIVRQRLLGLAYQPLLRHTLAAMDAVVATSPNYAASSRVLTGLVPQAKLRVIPLAIQDRSEAQRQSASTGICERLGVQPGNFVLSLGVLRYYKGLHTLVSAAGRIEAPVVIAGSGPEADRLMAQARDSGGKVVFAGQVTDEEKDELLQACSVFAFPSHVRSEAFGMVLVEASMFATPMVTCDIGSGMSYVNKSGETGLSVQPQCPDELGEAINRIMADKKLAQEMGAAARKRYELLFSSEALGRAYASLYRELLNKRI